MVFADFAQFLEEIESLSGRTEMTKKVVELFGKLKGEEIKYAMYLLQGRLVPKFIPVEFNFSSKMILKALKQVHSDEREVVDLFTKLGDAGLTAEEVVKNYSVKDKERGLFNDGVLAFKDKKLDISEVYEGLKLIATATGKGSQESKMGYYLTLISALDLISIRYVTRMIVGTIRLGISDKTILDALSWFKVGDKSLRSDLDLAFGKKADIGELAQIVLESKGDLVKVLEEIEVEPGVPIASKLVEREIDAQSVWKRMPECYVQPKLDGLRGQLHYTKQGQQKISDGPHELDAAEALIPPVSIFSRNMETMTDQFPEIAMALTKLKVDSIILDSEIIGYDEKSGQYSTYQDTMRRRRKYDIGEFSKNIPVKAMCFDILYLNGKDLTQEPLEHRIEILSELLSKEHSALKLLETRQMQSEAELENYFTEKVENGLEGIIAKQLGTTYEPGTRNFKWIKLKANTRSDLVDTIDVVVLGYYAGKGDRSRFGFGTLLAGVYDPKEDKYYSIGKVGSGFKEEEMPGMLIDLQKMKVQEQPENVVVEKLLWPDVWVEPSIVMEIVADEITRSPSHTAARGKTTNVKNDDPARGLSIRFPRMKIWKRDKDLPNTVDEVVRMYELRKGK